MGILKNRLLRKFTPGGKAADAAILGGAALRMAARKGIITPETAAKFGAKESSGGEALSAAEMMLLIGAAWRLMRRVFSGRRGKTEKIIIDV